MEEKKKMWSVDGDKFARVKGDFVVLFARLNIRRSWNRSRLKATAGIIIIKRRAAISSMVPPGTFTISSDNRKTEDLFNIRSDIALISVNSIR